MKTKQTWAVIIAVLLFLITGISGVVSGYFNNKMLKEQTKQMEDSFSEIFGIAKDSVEADYPDKDFVARIDIVGTIQASAPASYISATAGGQYNHDLYMKTVDDLMDNDKNKGILLYVDSPGGTVYESDELYEKLMEYKEKTKRPIYAYFASQACSGGYYISMAADKIYANRNCWTGSIGVIVSLTNYKDLMDKLGVKQINITSGRNKAIGSAAEELTDEQEKILQSLVDEAYEQFTGIVAEGRDLPVARVKTIADGRIYSAQQAKDIDLVDDIMGEEEALKALNKDFGMEEDAEYYVPGGDSMSDIFSSLFSKASSAKEKSELEILNEMMNDSKNGELMYYAE
ncbi:MAG: signal peptide peptidase SppA [Lachnospiraceae bacterium]|nr:signal peptide peptidase SppA [Lachnospiraceae bacterium]